MEENKKQENQEHVKIYDKEMYISQEKLRTIILIIVVFVLGFIAGYFSREVISDSSETVNNPSYTNESKN